MDLFSLYGLDGDRPSSFRIRRSLLTSWRRDPISTGRMSPWVPDYLWVRTFVDGRRPRFVVLGELYMTDDSILVQGYNDKWRKQRKILHQALVPRSIQKYKVIQDAESKRLLWDLLQNPKHFETHLNRYPPPTTPNTAPQPP